MLSKKQESIDTAPAENIMVDIGES